MFSFPVLISLIVPILIFFLTLHITLKKEIEDLKFDIAKFNLNNKKIHIRKKTLKTLNITTLLLLCTVLLLFFLPSIVDLINTNELYFDFKPINFSTIGGFLLKLVPFKEGFFSDVNFKFSYITGIILSIIILIIWRFFLNSVIEPTYKSEYILLITILILLSFGLIWANNFISMFLSYCIIHYFALLSIVLNLIIYSLICAIISFIVACFE